MPDRPAAPEVRCLICGKAWRKNAPGVRPAPGGAWRCAPALETSCLERRAAMAAAIVDARDNPGPVQAAREALEALLNKMAGDWRIVYLIMNAADRYASAASADVPGLDAILGPGRLADADAEYHPATERQASQ